MKIKNDSDNQKEVLLGITLLVLIEWLCPINFPLSLSFAIYRGVTD